MMDADNGKGLQFSHWRGADANVYDQGTVCNDLTRAGRCTICHEDSPDKLSQVEEIKLSMAPKPWRLDPKTHNLYLVKADFSPADAKGEKRNA